MERVRPRAKTDGTIGDVQRVPKRFGVVSVGTMERQRQWRTLRVREHRDFGRVASAVGGITTEYVAAVYVLDEGRIQHDRPRAPLRIGTSASSTVDWAHALVPTHHIEPGALEDAL